MIKKIILTVFIAQLAACSIESYELVEINKQCINNNGIFNVQVEPAGKFIITCADGSTVTIVPEQPKHK